MSSQPSSPTRKNRSPAARSRSKLQAVQAALIALVPIAVGCSAGGAGTTGSDAGVDNAADAAPARNVTVSDDVIGDRCKLLLSCTLAATPDVYGEKLAVYGTESACWKSAAQRESCEEACDKSYASLKSVCNCNGTECTALVLEAGAYRITTWNAQRDDCKLESFLRQSTFTVVDDVDSSDPQMTLNATGGSPSEQWLSLRGKLTNGTRGKLRYQLDGVSAEAAVHITDTRHFDGDFAFALNEGPNAKPCTTTLALTFEQAP